jgi:hypothetical protein
VTAWVRAALLLFAALPALAPAAEQHQQADVPFVVTPPNVVDAMLKIADVGARDFVIDLGSGDGRILITAAKQYGARGLGVDIDPQLVDIARQQARREGVADRVRFIVENLFTTELDSATVLTMYLYPRVMTQLRPRMFAELKPGSRIVSHEFDMEDWPADGRVTIPVPDKPYGPPSSDVFLWILPANAAGVWRWRAAEMDYEVTLSQTFQALEGGAVAGGRAGRVERGKMQGDEIRLTLTAEVGGRMQRQELSGRVSGDSISGTIKTDGGERDWKAARARRGNIDIKQ